jgi:hypothetical protein
MFVGFRCQGSYRQPGSFACKKPTTNPAVRRGLCHTKISVTLEPITSEQATLRAAAAPHTGAGLQVVKVSCPRGLPANP